MHGNRWILVLAALASLTLGPAHAGAAEVEIANVPLINNLTKIVPPNIHFILDDSGSMAWDYMPDAVSADSGKRCFRNFGRNNLYYNPAITYVPPVKADGTSYPDSSYTAAWNNGFAGGATTNLSGTTVVSLGSNPFSVTTGSRTVTVTHNSHGYSVGDRITFSGAPDPMRGVSLNKEFTIDSIVNSNSYRVVIDGASPAATSSGTGGGGSVKVNFPTWHYFEHRTSPTAPPATCEAASQYQRRWPVTTAEKQNFANWYSYYRTRILTMKSAAGRAFSTVNDKYRVGLDVISNNSSSSVRVKIKKFDATQKADWYTQLYAASATGWTPLRGALSKAGRMYAGKVITGTEDPVQYACQQNFAILTTDGYWNTNAESATYGPRQMDNVTLVGDRDGTQPRPFLDALAIPNTLADIAMYYYETDLRPNTLVGPARLGGYLDGTTTRLDVTADIVPTVGADTNTKQHMVLFGLGLGVDGVLKYNPNYLDPSLKTGSYYDILQGTANWPDPKPTVAAENPARIDDLWHAAVNARGRYLSAKDPDQLITALNQALSAITKVNGSAAAAATSTLEPVAGDNYAYVAQYTTKEWSGDLIARKIELLTGKLEGPTWSASTELAKRVEPSDDTRDIYTYDAAADDLKSFEAGDLADEIALGYFDSSTLSQYSTWTTAQKTEATAEAMIDYLRGQTGNEIGTTNDLFRKRTTPLGDIINSSPVYVRKPPFNYGDAGYAEFVAAQSSRPATVYVGSNGGMLHAFDATDEATGGQERWAYVPRMVIPSLRRLADANYESNHEYYVDGPITVGDAYDAADSEWKTVLVGGLGRGGRGYYALDVTDPTDPEILWEFGTDQDADIGYSYGNPLLTKRNSDGKWVVLVTSGYNNTLGDGRGRLYVLDAFSGAVLSEIVTDSSVTDPNSSGIAKINNWVLDTMVDNTTQYVYGGDLSGNVWRFDVGAATSQRLGRTSATAGNQPITVRPELSRAPLGGGLYARVVHFGTGRYLGFGDLLPTAPSQSIAQGIYAVKDTGSDVGVLTSAGAGLVAQTLDTTVTPRRIPSPAVVDWGTDNGWYVTLPVGERVNVDQRLQLGTIVTVANEPKDEPCSIGGRSWLYALDYLSGAPVTTATSMEVGKPIGSSIAAGLTLIRLPNDKLIALVTLSDTSVEAVDVPAAPGGATTLRRIGWREIF